MRHTVRTLAVLAAIGALAGGAVVAFGLYNVSARAGHWQGVGWLLHTTYRSSVGLRAPAVETVPDLSDPDLAFLGARHFETACAFCHATPGTERHATSMSMNPQPPHITQAIADWEPRHLHWIVDEGVKMSGMPHWPATNREDEIWSVVAWLEAVRDGATVPPSAATATDDATLDYCASCHGTDGRSFGNAHIPRLDIQPEPYLAQSLAAYRDGTRESGIMFHAATRISKADLARMATHYAGPAEEPAAPPRGPALATEGTDTVPACTSCHGPGATRGNDAIPRLAGQSEAYLAAQLRLWRSGTRGGGPRAELMTKSAARLSDDEIEELAAWFAGLNG